MKNAEIIAVGSELLTPDKIDTNSLYLTGQLNLLGVEVVSKSIIGDDRQRLTAAVSTAIGRSAIVILTGGLGPTEDDVTRDAVASALGRSMTYYPEITEGIAERFRRMGRQMPEINKRQAFLIDGAEMLPNGNGTAPGQYVREDRRVVVLLPGPPRELKLMYEQQVHARLRELLPPMVIRTRIYRIAGLSESDVDSRVAPVYSRYENPATTILAAAGDIQLHLRSRANSELEAETLLQEVGSQIEPLLGAHLYSRNGASLDATVGELLQQRRETLSTAESCTGGLVAQRMTSNAGSSQYFLGGFVTYTDEMKINLLGVEMDLIERHTSVSEAVAEAMAIGAQQRTGSSYALSITGIAGPDGGTADNPVGTVWIGLATAQACTTHRFRFAVNDRERVRILAAQTALDLLRRKVAGVQ